MRPQPLLALLAAVLFACAASAAEDLVLLEVTEHDRLLLTNGDEILGLVIEERETAIVFQQFGRSSKVAYTRDQIGKLERKRDAATVVALRGAQLLARKPPDLQGLRKTIEWGREKGALDAALELGLKVSSANPSDQGIGAVTLALLKQQERSADLEALARSLLKASPAFEPAFDALAETLTAQKRQDELLPLAQQFLQVLPTSPVANRIMAAMAERNGELKQAQEAYRKLFELHKDAAAGVGYARTSLKLGQAPLALKAANALIASGQHVDAAKAFAGIANLAAGNISEALAQLSAIDLGQLDPETAMLARYDLGLAHWRAGAGDKAKAQWAGLDVPAARLALAIAERRPFAEEVAGDKRLAAIAREHNACLALEAHKPDKALAGLDAATNARHQFLVDVAQVLKTNGSDASLRAIARTETPEALRWQAYGLILARRWRDAEAVLARLPEDDGYALAYRVYAAVGQNDRPRARELFKKAAATKGGPADYLGILASEVGAEDEEVQNEEFQWVAGEVLGSGWQAQAAETNIHVHTDGQNLIFDGTQTPGQDPVTRAWRMAPSARMRTILAKLDIAAIESAVVGIEVLDAARKNGLAYGVLAENKLGYRTLKSGAWGPWQALSGRVDGTQTTLRLDVNAGRVFAAPYDLPTQREAVGDLPAGDYVTVGLFGTAETGVAWKMAIDRLELQMKRPVAPKK
ncbi:MAG: hypothetical protein H0W72_03845 [Planctomycetes bacterium]|nr:hypothetical protein [Planctomycetota bacterium]